MAKPTKAEKAADELNSRVTDMAGSSVLEDANDILADTSEYFTRLADMLAYIEDDEDPEAVKAVAKEFMESAISTKAATLKEFDETIEKFRKLAS